MGSDNLYIYSLFYYCLDTFALCLSSVIYLPCLRASCQPCVVSFVTTNRFIFVSDFTDLLNYNIDMWFIVRHSSFYCDRVRPFFKVSQIFGAQPCAGRAQWAQHEDIKIFDIGQCLLFTFVSRRFSFIIIIYKINIYCYNNMSNIFSLNRLEAKVKIFQFQKTWYPCTQFTKIYQHKVEPLKLWKKGAPYYCDHILFE